MTALQRTVLKAQRRLWMNRAISAGCTSLAIGAAAFALIVLVQRLWNFDWPVLLLGEIAAGLVVVGAGFYTLLTREDPACAAAALDDAAGLRERISSGLYCASQSGDPFAAAVVGDAERVSASVTPRQHLRLSVPRHLSMSGVAVVLAALMFLVTPGLMLSDEAEASQEQDSAVRQSKLTVKRKLEEIRELTEKSEATRDFAESLEGLERAPDARMDNPEQIRHEAVKKLDKLADAIKQKRDDPRYNSLDEMRKMMRKLDPPKSSESNIEKMKQSLRRGDVRTAKEELAKLQEKLATLKNDEEPELQKQVAKQLKQMAEQLEKAADQEKQQKDKLKKEGLTEEQAKRALEQLKKADLNQLKKQLQQAGMDKQKAEQMAKQMAQQQQAGEQSKQLAQKLMQAANAAAAGNPADAAAKLADAGAQLSDLEQLEQEMQQLDAAQSAAQQAMNDISKPCAQCGGSGCKSCNGTGNQSGGSSGSGGGNGGDPGGDQGQGDGLGDGQDGKQQGGQGKGKRGGGMGGEGKGRGGIAPEEVTRLGFKTERGKVETRKGAIIGQFEVEGEQVAGEVNSRFAEVVTAAEREASERVSRDRVPRQYHKAVKKYFSDLKGALDSMPKADKGDGSAKSGGGG